MVDLIQKLVDCYKIFILHLNRGAMYDYRLLFEACLVSKEHSILDNKTLEYFINNLDCLGNTKLENTNFVNMLLGYTLDKSTNVLSELEWIDTKVPKAGEYTITTIPKGGFNYFYVSIPKQFTLTVRDEMGNDITSGFLYVGETTTLEGKQNSVYKKDNMFNSGNSIKFKIILT